MSAIRCIQGFFPGPILNVILADPATFNPKDGSSVIASATGNVGDTYNAGVITPAAPPAPTVPSSVAMWQAKAALQNAGLLTQANSAVAGSGNVALQQYWATAQTLNRSDPSVAMIGAGMSLTPVQIDALFIAAAGISV